MTRRVPESADLDPWRISPVDFSHHFAYFHRITPHGQTLGGARAREFFLQSRLPAPTLSTIWSLSDVDGDGRLSAAEFCVAMHLVQLASATHPLPLPTSLPPSLLSIVHLALDPQLPLASGRHIHQCHRAFSSFHTSAGKGVLDVEAAKYLFSKSNLSRGQQFHIWMLADGDQDGHLSFVEFTVAMHLIFVAKLGYFLPTTLDPHSILPPSFYSIIKEIPPHTQTKLKQDSDRIALDPFPPPSSDTPPPTGENPFVSDTFITQATERFREGGFVDFDGDPFAPPYSNGSLPPTSSSPSPPPPPHQVHHSPSLSHGTSSPSSSSLARHQDDDAAAHPNGHAGPSPSPPPLTRASRGGSREVVRERTEPTLQVAMVTAIHPPPGQQQKTEPSAGGGRGSGRSSSAGGGRGSRRSSTSNLSSSESGSLLGPLSAEEVSTELESLSRASRRLLQESYGRLAEQRRRNLPGGSDFVGQEEFISASLRGLSGTIDTLQGDGADLLDDGGTMAPVGTATSHIATSSSEVLVHLADLEAQVLSTLMGVVSLEEGEGVDGGEPARSVTPPPATPTSAREVHTRQRASNTVSSERAPPLQATPPGRRTRKPVWRAPPPPSHVPPPQRPRASTLPCRSRHSRTRGASMEGILDLLDLDDELADIQDVLQQFDTQDKRAEQRTRSETAELRAMEQKAKELEDKPLSATVASMEAMQRKKERQSADIEREWEEDMKRLEREGLLQLEEEQRKRDEEDETVTNIEKELKALIEQEEEHVKQAKKEKEVRLAREKEEEERREIERKAKVESREELTVEEWIVWMEEQKRQGMSEAQVAEYQRRKRLWAQREAEREEKRQREEEDQIRRTKERMDSEYKSFTAREKDVREHRLSAHELVELREAKAVRDEQEKLEREERHRTRLDEDRHRELEWSKPKAQSALAARWEESVKARTGDPRDKNYRKTVVSGGPEITPKSLEREEQRLQRRVSQQNGDPLAPSSDSPSTQ